MQKNNKTNSWIGITITQIAEKYIQSIIKNNKFTQYIKIKIKKSGCAGFKYSLSIINDLKKYKNKKYYIYNKNNIIIYINIKYMHILDGTEIDLVQKNGINYNIIFNNTKIKTFCGCGESFQILPKI